MDLQALKAEIQNDPSNLGLAALANSGATGLVAESLNQVSLNNQVIDECWLTDRGLTAELLPALGLSAVDAIFNKLELAGETSNTIKRMVARLGGDMKGLDFADAGLRAMITSFSGSVLTTVEANALLNLPYRNSTRAEVLFGANVIVKESDVISAISLE